MGAAALSGFALGVSGAAQPDKAVLFGLGCLSGLFLSPDLDMSHTRPANLAQRVNAFLGFGWRFLWRPYARLIPHRHFLSHSYIISTAIHLVYLVAILWGLAWLWGLGYPYARPVLLSRLGFWAALEFYLSQARALVPPLRFSWAWVWPVAGLVLSDSLHIFLDYLPKKRPHKPAT